MSDTTLIRYDQARIALHDCVQIDEAAQIRDKAAALRAYARQRDDAEMGVWVSEIHLRACVRIGELSRELETAEREGPAGNYRIPAGGKSKADALAEAGISTTTAHRYEEIAGGRDDQAIAAAQAATEAHFAKARQDKVPATMQSLRGAIREALVETLGEPQPKPMRRGRPKMAAEDAAFTDLSAAIRHVGQLDRGVAQALASEAEPSLVDWHIEVCGEAIANISAFRSALRKRGTKHAA